MIEDIIEKTVNNNSNRGRKIKKNYNYDYEEELIKYIILLTNGSYSKCLDYIYKTNLNPIKKKFFKDRIKEKLFNNI